MYSLSYQETHSSKTIFLCSTLNVEKSHLSSTQGLKHDESWSWPSICMWLVGGKNALYLFFQQNNSLVWLIPQIFSENPPERLFSFEYSSNKTLEMGSSARNNIPHLEKPCSWSKTGTADFWWQDVYSWGSIRLSLMHCCVLHCRSRVG